MKRIYFFVLFSMVFNVEILAQDTFYKQYEFALETDHENIRYSYSIDDTLRLISIRTGSTVGINFSLIDTKGDVISNIYHDDIFFFQEAIIYDEEEQEFIFDGISRLEPPNKNCIFRMDKYGNLIESKCNQYAIPDSNEIGDVDNVLHMTKTDFGYASSGGEFLENGRYGFLNLFDKDLELIFSDTLSKYRYIANIAYDGQGGINAIGLVQNIAPQLNHLDSMMFLKINQFGDVIREVRIPHTQNIPELNGHYPFITNIVTGESYLFDDYDYDTTSSFNVLPRIAKLDKDGNIIWQFNDWKTQPRLLTNHLYLKQDGNLMAYGNVSYRDVTTNNTSSSVQLVSIDKDGNFLWDKIFYDLVTIEDDIEKRYLFSRHITEDSEANIYFGLAGALAIAGATQNKPFLIKLAPDGCFTSDCRTTVNVGDFYKPNNLVTERNEIHIYNKDTDKSYRYTFYRRDDVERGGKLLKSLSMSGDEDWKSTGRDFTGQTVANEAPKTFIREHFDPTDPYPEIWIDWHYNFTYEVGDRLKMEHSFITRTDYLRVVVIEDITLLDGRTKSKYILECENLDPDGNPYPERIWIEDIGDINDFLNTPYACSNPGNEVITCFFSDGELIWQHPEYDFCIVETEDSHKNQFAVFPNPTQDFLKCEIAIQDYIIFDIYGKRLLAGKKIGTGESIDVSGLITGQYILICRNMNGNKLIEKFVKN